MKMINQNSLEEGDQIPLQGSPNQQHQVLTSQEDSDTYSSNYSFVIEMDRVQVLVDFGYPQEYVFKCL